MSTDGTLREKGEAESSFAKTSAAAKAMADKPEDASGKEKTRDLTKRQIKLGKIKERWKKLPEAKQELWFAKQKSETVPETGERIEKELRIKPLDNNQVVTFRKWLRQEEAARIRARLLGQTEENIQKANPGWALERVREQVLRNAYEWSLEMKDFRVGMQTASAHCRVEGTRLNQRRYEDFKRSDEEKALAVCLDEAKRYPEIQVLFREAFAALKKAQDAE